ncbi:Hypothetical_protein [Hexamita inflata]|uniref:Hypothetical_protein n=1 Tax=Hexamita inflata TaxID=28002 RepID=A0AA86Q5C5_9EUKA|nr:Hypothetical protein HINF_LOCUS37272 [Hexamita inflata]
MSVGSAFSFFTSTLHSNFNLFNSLPFPAFIKQSPFQYLDQTLPNEFQIKSSNQTLNNGTVLGQNQTINKTFLEENVKIKRILRQIPRDLETNLNESKRAMNPYQPILMQMTPEVYLTAKILKICQVICVYYPIKAVADDTYFHFQVQLHKQQNNLTHKFIFVIESRKYLFYELIKISMVFKVCLIFTAHVKLVKINSIALVQILLLCITFSKFIIIFVKVFEPVVFFDTAFSGFNSSTMSYIKLKFIQQQGLYHLNCYSASFQKVVNIGNSIEIQIISQVYNYFVEQIVAAINKNYLDSSLLQKLETCSNLIDGVKLIKMLLNINISLSISIKNEPKYDSKYDQKVDVFNQSKIKIAYGLNQSDQFLQKINKTQCK